MSDEIEIDDLKMKTSDKPMTPQRKYYLKNRDVILAKQKAYNLVHAEEAKIRAKSYYESYYKQYHREYYHKQKAAMKAYNEEQYN